MLQYRSAGETLRIGKFGTFAVSRGLRGGIGCEGFVVLMQSFVLVRGRATSERSQKAIAVEGRTWKIGVSDLVDIISVRAESPARGGRQMSPVWVFA